MSVTLFFFLYSELAEPVAMRLLMETLQAMQKNQLMIMEKLFSTPQAAVQPGPSSIPTSIPITISLPTAPGAVTQLPPATVAVTQPPPATVVVTQPPPTTVAVTQPPPTTVHNYGVATFCLMCSSSVL